MQDPDFSELRAKLEQNSTWPMLYMFKFIVPSDNKRIAQVQNLFDDGAEISSKESSGGKYTSITARQVVLSADMVIEIYQKASRIEGVIAL